ncbi:FCD domain-containing protein [Phenylobacterium sp. LjRoot225]|uniref:FadR/GntR family transcriptional regulator n=1 Tax=Phenylobacterium sp. LjRoot225 TaxID=3342285 RepID=UPI003ECE2D3E
MPKPADAPKVEGEKVKLQKRHLVQAAADRLRDLILAAEPDTQIGSLNEVARELGVGIVTVQQAARILEHEGLLEVRRGPGGGYYGKRPDEAALERSIAAYIRVHPAAFKEVSEIVSLLDCELIPAAARCTDEVLRAALRGLAARVETSDTAQARIALEQELHNTLYKMVNRPLIELLTRVTSQLQRSQPAPPLFSGPEGVAAWKAGRSRILQAVLAQDEELARFEAVRYRQGLIARLRRLRGEGPAAV